MIVAIIMSIEQSLGERFFVGLLSGLVFCVVMAVIKLWSSKRAKNKERMEKLCRSEQTHRDIAKSIALGSGLAKPLDYGYLCTELKEKCNPSNFLSPYDAHKVEIANSIFSQVNNSLDIVDLIELRNQAILELGISFSAEELFSRLSAIYNPSNFIGDNYDAEKLLVSNKIYALILQNRDDIIALEKITIDNSIDYFIRPTPVLPPIKEPAESSRKSLETDVASEVSVISVAVILVIIFVLLSFLLSFLSS